MMFPSNVNFEIKTEQSSEVAGKSFLFDYVKGEFVLKDGVTNTIKGTEAVRQWVELFLRTRPGVYKVYDGMGFGVDTRQLINLPGLPEGFLRSEFERSVREGLALNPNISYADCFEYARVAGRTTEIKFTVHLKSGEETEVVAHA